MHVQNYFSLQELSSDISFIGTDISCDSWLPGKIYRKPFRFSLFLLSEGSITAKNLRKVVIAFLKATLSTSMWFLRWTRPKWEKGPKSNSCEFTIKSNEPGKEFISIRVFWSTSVRFWILPTANHCHEGGGSVRIWLHWEVAEYGSDSERNGDCYPIKVSISIPCQVWTFSYFRLIYVAKWLLHGYATIRKVFPKV